MKKLYLCYDFNFSVLAQKPRFRDGRDMDGERLAEDIAVGELTEYLLRGFI